MIYLIANNTALFNSDGMGDPLPDALSCEVQEIRNGAFCAVLAYIYDGENADKIAVNAVLMIEPRPGANREPFRIYEIDQTIKGILTVRANHLAYDLDGRIAFGMTAVGITQAINNINTWAGSHFEIINDGITDETTDFKIAAPVSVWATIGGSNSLLSHFGGELSYEWNQNTKKVKVILHNARGTEKRTVITYGVNIISIERKRTVGGMYSTVIAYWSDNENPANTVFSSSVSTGVSALDRWYLLDCSKQFQTAPTSADLTAIATEYVAKNDFTTQDELSVEYIPIENTTEYEPLPVAVVGSAIVGTSVVGNARNLMQDEQLDLCDIGTVDASFVGVSAKAKCVEVVYDALKKRYSKTTIGTLQNTIVDQIIKLSEG